MTNAGGIDVPLIPDDAVPEEIRQRVADASDGEILDHSYPYRERMGRKEYEEVKGSLQVELLKMQRWVQDRGERVALVFEGRDAAGKGGTIKRFMEHLNPRGARVVALAKPTERELGQWYFQRYIEHLPTAGELVFFDRSWYNRAVVEPVMGFCTPTQNQTFLREAPMLESMLVNDGLHLYKFWFSVSRAEQYRRFKSREKDELKRWKLSPVDTESLAHWDSYTHAKNTMFAATDTAAAPWTVVRSDDKKRARLACLRYVLASLPYDNKSVDVVGVPDPAIIGAKEIIYPDNNW